MIDFLCQIEILLWNMLKIQGFTRFFFFKISQISGIFRSFMPKLSNSRICGNPIFSIYKYLSKIKSFVKNKKMTCRF